MKNIKLFDIDGTLIETGAMIYVNGVAFPPSQAGNFIPSDIDWSEFNDREKWLYDKNITNYCINYRTKKIIPRKLKIVNESMSDFDRNLNEIKFQLLKLYPEVKLSYYFRKNDDVYEIKYDNLKPEYYNTFHQVFNDLCEKLLYEQGIENFYCIDDSQNSFEDMFSQIQIQLKKSYPDVIIAYKTHSTINYERIGITPFIRNFISGVIKKYVIECNSELESDETFVSTLKELCGKFLDNNYFSNYSIKYNKMEERIKYLTEKLNTSVFDSGETIEVLKSQYDYLCEQVEFIDNMLHKLAHEFEPKIKLLIKSKSDTLQLKKEITQIYKKVCLLVSAENPKRMTFDNLYNRYVDID